MGKIFVTLGRRSAESFGTLERFGEIGVQRKRVNDLSFLPMGFQTVQYSRCFILTTTNLWNELPCMIVEAADLKQFKLGANALLSGVDQL